ncbi:hypothetical protein LXL04_014835 [Taraxacum kok-saghyz]
MDYIGFQNHRQHHPHSLNAGTQIIKITKDMNHFYDWDLLRTHIFPRTPKPLTFSKNRVRGAKNHSNTSPVAKKNFRKNDYFFKNFAYVQKYFLHMCTFFCFVSKTLKYLKKFKFFIGCWDLLRTHIFPRTRELPQFRISPKPLFLSKNRLRKSPKPVLKQNKKLCTYAQKKSLHICKVFGKKKSFFREFFFATGLIFERFLAPRSRFFEKVNGLGVLGILNNVEERSHLAKIKAATKMHKRDQSRSKLMGNLKDVNGKNMKITRRIPLKKRDHTFQELFLSV